MAKITLQEFHNMTAEQQADLVESYRRVYIGDNLNAAQANSKLNVSDNLGQVIRNQLPLKSRMMVAKCGRATYQQRTGYSHPMRNPAVVNKLIETNTEKYGGVGFQVDELATRSRTTCKERYGEENFAKSDLFADRLAESSMRKYGVTNPSKADSVKQKIRESQFNKYGKWYSQTDEFKQRSVETFIRNWGVTNPMYSLEVIKKIEQQNIEKWGVPYWMMAPENQKKLHDGCINKFGVNWYSSAHLPAETVEIIHDPDKLIAYVLGLPEQERTHNSVARLLGCSTIHLLQLTQSYGSRVREVFIMNPSASDAELGLRKLMESWGVKALYNDREVIKPWELDIYVPDKKFAIEYNGWYWHSKQSGTPVDYHQAKSRRCTEAGVQLYHIFENDWHNARKRPIIESQLRCKLLGISDRIFARKCNLRAVSIDEAREFMNNNHLQGYRNCSVRLGLYFDNELVCMMTFGKAYLHRNTNCWEIYRLCTKLNTTVVGGASRLFHAFLVNYTPNKIVTYSDYATGTGNVYTSLGFTPVSLTAPNYIWIKDGDQRSRYQCQMKNEIQTMESRNYVQLFDAGNVLWEYNLQTDDSAE